MAQDAYAVGEVVERHRHRYEFNNDYRDELGRAGLVISGTSPDGGLVEIVEIRDHNWMVGSQFHPELRSRPGKPHPLFNGFVSAAVGRSQRRRAPSGTLGPASRHSAAAPRATRSH
jgi:CTP synthase